MLRHTAFPSSEIRADSTCLAQCDSSTPGADAHARAEVGGYGQTAQHSPSGQQPAPAAPPTPAAGLSAVPCTLQAWAAPVSSDYGHSAQLFPPTGGDRTEA